MKKLLLVTALALTSAFVTAPRSSGQTAQFTFTPIGSLSAAPGQTIQFSINLNFVTGGNMPDVAGLTYFLQQTTGSTAFFTITARDITGSQFSDSITSAAQVAPQAMTDTNPSFSNPRDLGALYSPPAPPAPQGLPSGMYFIANITLQIAANATPGSYTIQSTTTGGKRSIVNDSSGFGTFPISPGSIMVTVIPEPSTYALIAFGGIALGVVAYRRRVLS
jgi:hypothetical protein